MYALRTTLIRAGFFVLFASMASGCAPVGMYTGVDALTGLAMVQGTPEMFSTTDYVALRKRPRDFLSKAKKIGGELGWTVSGVSSIDNQVSFTKSSGGMLGLALAGYMSDSDISLRLKGSRVIIELVMSGNYNTVSEDAANDILQSFKDKIRQNFT